MDTELVDCPGCGEHPLVCYCNDICELCSLVYTECICLNIDTTPVRHLQIVR